MQVLSGFYLLSCKFNSTFFKHFAFDYLRYKSIQVKTFCHCISFDHQEDFKSKPSLKSEEQILQESDEDRKVERFKVLKFLLNRGCLPSDIREKCASYIRSDQKNSYLKALLISEVDSDLVPLLPLMSLPLRSLRSAAKHAKEDKWLPMGFKNRLAYLSHHLEMSPVSDLVQSLVKHPALLTMKCDRLVRRMKILKDAGINSNCLAKDLWIFNYNESLLANRVLAAKQASVHLKPWMLRCSERSFESVVCKSSERHRILEGTDEIQYLAKMLQCTEDYVRFYMMVKNKLLKSIGIPKLEQILHFLFEKGYTAQEIRLFPRVFGSSVATLEKRFEQFSKTRLILPTISQLCVSTNKAKIMLMTKDGS